MDTVELNVLGKGSLRQRLSKARRKGLTLIEAAMVLAILALVVAGIMLFYTGANTSRLTTQAQSQLGMIQQAVRSTFGGQASFAGLSNTILINSKQLPTSMISGTTVRHAFNGAVTVAPATVNGITNGGWTATFTNVPGEGCTKMAAQDLGRGLVALNIGGTNIALPATVPAVTSACANSNNTIIWTFN